MLLLPASWSAQVIPTAASAGMKCMPNLNVNPSAHLPVHEDAESLMQDRFLLAAPAVNVLIL